MRGVTSVDGQAKPVAGARLSRLVFAFSATLIALSALSLFYVGRIASQEADQQAAATELKLFDNALRDRQSLMARDQLGLARWDRSVKYIALKFREAYISDEFVSSLWFDFGHERTFLVDPQGRVVMSARQDKVDFRRKQLDPNDDLAIVARRAVEAHMANRIAIGDGFGQKMVPSSEIREISEFSIAMVDGGPAIVSAMAIVPDDEEVVLPDGAPYILVSAKSIDRELVRDLNSQLAFTNLAYSDDTDGKVPLVSASGRTIGSFQWQAARPGSQIWDVVVPVIVFLSSLLAVASLFIVHRISGLSRLLEESERRNRELALRDPLSGLANRLSFDQALEAAAARCDKKPFAAIACDLDRFKAVNDTYGHAAGDLVIKTVGLRLQEAVGGNGLVGRIGGDEFVILVTAFCDRARLSLLASQIMTAVSSPVRLDCGAVTDVGVSLGIAIAPHSGKSPNTIMAAADRALYASKAGGRGRAVFVTDISDDADLPDGKEISDAA